MSADCLILLYIYVGGLLDTAEIDSHSIRIPRQASTWNLKSRHYYITWQYSFLLSLSNCSVSLFSVTRKGKLTGRPDRPVACRVGIWTLPAPLLLEFPFAIGWPEPKTYHVAEASNGAYHWPTPWGIQSIQPQTIITKNRTIYMLCTISVSYTHLTLPTTPYV